MSRNEVLENLSLELETYSLDEIINLLQLPHISEITQENDAEIVNMENVIAIFIDENNNVLEIKSDNAIFNSSSYNTNFSNNIRISYLDNKLSSNELILDFEKRIPDAVTRSSAVSSLVPAAPLVASSWWVSTAARAGVRRAVDGVADVAASG